MRERWEKKSEMHSSHSFSSFLSVCWLSIGSIFPPCPTGQGCLWRVCKCVSQSEFCRKTFITRNWLLQLWELARQGQNTRGRLPGQAGNSQSGAGTAFHRLNCFFLRETPVLLLRPFNWSDRAHPDYPGHSPLHKNHWLWMLIPSAKCLHSNTYLRVWLNNCVLTKLIHKTARHNV